MHPLGGAVPVALISASFESLAESLSFARMSLLHEAS